jgi:Protein of unknown function (DUF1592)/Protein of unknown function (DUF1588)/Protein of unknown function (DUF1585)/Protein of unknown function (DUF1595)/Protein of unknown function (DUF1587)
MIRTLAAQLGVTAAAAVLTWNAGLAASSAGAAPSAGAQPTASAASAAPASALGSKTAEQAPPGGDHDWGMLKDYCEKCHNAEDWAGGVAFDTMTPADINDNAETFEKAVRKLRGRLMPPPGNKQPPSDTIHSFVHWMEGNLDTAAEKRPPDPGRVALHRLNRKEYANAIWDLLTVKVDPNTVLPTDDVIDGFDNVANVLQVSPSFLDQYLAAARTIAVDAVGQVPGRPNGTQYIVDRGAGNQQFYEEGLPLGTRGGLQVTHFFPADGEYELNVGNMAAALWVTGMNFDNHLVATLDGKKFWETDIGGEQDMKSIDQKQDPAVDAINKRLKGIRFKATAGPHKVAVTFVHRTFAESDDKLYSQFAGGGQDRVLRLANFEVRGPFNPTGISETPSREKIFVCQPKAPAEEVPCAGKILQQLARNAYRRPVTEADMKQLVAFYHRGRDGEGGNFDEGIRHALTAILASPYFLYRAEPVPQTVSAGGTYRINDFELASRLSFFLWSSSPDDELLRVAGSGKLHEPDVLRQQVHRMLADKRSETLASNFAYQWLGMGKLSEINPDMNVFPYAGDPRPEYLTELDMFVDSVFREDQNVINLLTANYTYLNERLALMYGINDVKGDRFRRVTLTDSDRYGLLGKGAVLMVSSYPNRTAPVLRGKWILESITGTPPAAPPPNVPQIKDTVAGEKPKTMRELMAEHRKQSSCFACHGVMDPLGLALENFDAVGVWRTKDRLAGDAIDASGELPDGTKINGPNDLRKALVSNPDQFVQTLTEKLMTYALGRTVEWRDMPTVRKIVSDGAKDGYRFSSIVMGIIDSEQFQMRSVPKDDSMAHKTQTAQRQ